MSEERRDAVVIGAGPNGLCAAITLALAGKSVLVLEAAETVGGGARSGERTLPGYIHDYCAAFFPLGAGSPFLRSLPLEEHGLEWVHPPLPLAHPFDDGSAAVLARSLAQTGASFEHPEDAAAYRKLLGPLVVHWRDLLPELLAPLHLPSHPLRMAQVGMHAIRPASQLARARFEGEKARGFFAGLAAHSFLPLEWWGTSAFGMLLGGAGHVVGWPIARGGAGKISEALAAYFERLGGEIVTGTPVTEFRALPPADAYLFDVTPGQLMRICGDALPERYTRRLGRFRRGPGAFKVDYALDGPIPWTAPACARAGTLHLGATLEEIAASEAAIWNGRTSDTPYVLVGQQSLFDDTRAPEGKHTCWAYAHVPHGSTEDITEKLEAQIERFAPGFRDRVLARVVQQPADLEAYNANYVGGDINGGSAQLSQLFFRPVLRRRPHTTPNPQIFLCSSSTPPGGGVHGMCGYHAAKAVLRRS